MQSWLNGDDVTERARKLTPPASTAKSNLFELMNLLMDKKF